MTALDVTIITGMSGAGRSSAGDVLEDLGFFVIDNLPPALIPKVVELARGRDEPSRFVLVVDVRSGAFVDDLDHALGELQAIGIASRVVFLDASDDALVRRFEETRRRHPLAGTDGVLEGIARERSLLEGLRGRADLVVDTSALNVHTLRARLHELFGDGAPAQNVLQTSVVSFGYKHGIPVDVDLLFDCRFLPNPHWVDDLRARTGHDPAVREYVMSQPDAGAFVAELERLLALLVPAYQKEGRVYLSIGVGCTGGRHRSVVIAGELAGVLRRLGIEPRVLHRDVDRA